MELKPGSRWKSAVCESQILIIRPPSVDGELQCGGVPVLEQGDASETSGDVDPAHAAGVLIGKRYTDAASGIEVLGAKPGKGSLSFNGVALVLKEAKPLPASD